MTPVEEISRPEQITRVNWDNLGKGSHVYARRAYICGDDAFTTAKQIVSLTIDAKRVVDDDELTIEALLTSKPSQMYIFSSKATKITKDKGSGAYTYPLGMLMREDATNGGLLDMHDEKQDVQLSRALKGSGAGAGGSEHARNPPNHIPNVATEDVAADEDMSLVTMLAVGKKRMPTRDEKDRQAMVRTLFNHQKKQLSHSQTIAMNLTEKDLNQSKKERVEAETKLEEARTATEKARAATLQKELELELLREKKAQAAQGLH